MNKLHIITRCTRPQNLRQIRETIITGNKSVFKITWHIVFDTNVLKDVDTGLLHDLGAWDSMVTVDFKFMGSSSGAYGYDSINRIVSFLSTSENEWIYLLDDDNILHENFHELSEIMDTNTEKSVIVFNQYIGGRDFTGLEYRKAAVENTKVGGIDAAQYVIAKKMISWPTGTSYKWDYCADGILMSELLSKNPDSFLFVDKVYCHYNYIQSSTKNFSLPRVLVLGIDEPIKMESIQYADYEAKELNTKFVVNDNNLDEVIQKFNPDAIVTLGTKYDRFTKMSSKSVDIRKRWIHHNEYDETIGDKAYHCANGYILSGHYSDNENPLVSFFTPFHNTGDKLKRTYLSLKNQSYANWEWVLVNDSTDNGKTLRIAEDLASQDCRIRVYDFREKSGGVVGESKYRAAMLSNGKYLMELDHDDVLTEDAAELMVKAFNDYPDCKFVYSDCAEIWENHSCIKYGDGFAFGYGSYRTEEYNGREYDVMNTSNINPKTIRHIVGVPNHFRAWDAEFYRSIGGHNRRLTIADDYELIVRTFLKTKMVRIPKLLYLQYYHNSNTQNLTRADIQRRVKSIRYHYNEAINKRFIELGVKDWAYEYNSVDPLWAPSIFGDDEGVVNYTMELDPSLFKTTKSEEVTYLI